MLKSPKATFADQDPHHLKFVYGIEFGLIGKLGIRKHFERVGQLLPNIKIRINEHQNHLDYKVTFFVFKISRVFVKVKC